MLTVAALVILVLPTCDTVIADVQTRLGISLSDEGSPQVDYILCQGEWITRVDLWQPDESAVVGDAGDVVLWRIVAARRTPVSRFKIGETPRGFHAEVELEEPIEGGVEYSIGVTSNLQKIAARGFRVGELSSHDVLTFPDAVVTRSRFEQQGRAGC